MKQNAIIRPISQPIIRNRQLTIDELKTIPIPMQIQDSKVIIEYSLRNSKLRNPVILDLDKVLATKEKGLITYILSSFLSERPMLLTLVFDNQTVIKMARHFLRHCSGSLHSCYSYSQTIEKYSIWLGYSPDLIISDTKPIGNIPDSQRVQNHCGYVDEYIAELQDEGLSPGRVHTYAKHVKTFYKVNGVKIELAEPLSRRITCKDRAPKPEELAKLIDISQLREKTIICMLALGALREETLSKLKYRHVQEDLENNRIPIHIHVEAEITKGKYHDYDTFIGQEAAHYLKLYLEQRKKGTRKIPPETLTPESPLFRNQNTRIVKSIGPKQIRKLVHDLYIKAGLIKEKRGRMFDLRVHSLRKYFKTQMLAIGVQPDYVEYMMGHTEDTYLDIQSLGMDTLRNIYTTASLSIKPKTRVSKIDALKEIIRAWGMNPEQLLTKDALTQAAITNMNPTDMENHQLVLLSNQLKELIRNETR